MSGGRSAGKVGSFNAQAKSFQGFQASTRHAPCMLLVIFLTMVDANQAPSFDAAALLVPAKDLPLRTKGRFVVGQSGRRVMLACVNWYGASQRW